MKNTIIYYLAIIAPLAAISFLSENATVFFILMLAYAFVYRPVTDFFRLKNKRLIQKKDFIKLYNPFFREKFAKGLYCN